MSIEGQRKRTDAMASKWRRRCMCVLIGNTAGPAAIRDISARGAFLETNQRPALGSSIELRHPDAGSITGQVRSLATDGVGITFSLGASSVAFALAAIGADMSRAG